MVQDTRNGLGTEQDWTTSDYIGLDSVTREADQLMNDLFSEIDQILEAGKQLPRNSKTPEYVSLQSVVVPPIHLPTPPPEPEQPTSSSSDASQQVATTPPTPHIHRSFPTPDRLLFGFACLSLLAVVGWLWTQEQLEFSYPKPLRPKIEAGVTPVSESDADFIEYMERSLAAISRPAQNPEPLQPLPSASPTPATTPSNETTQAPTVLERIYIPVYPSQSPAVQTPSPSATPAPQASVSPSSPQVPSPPPPPPPTATTLPSIPASPMPTAPTLQHTLVGLLELGERSAALFNIEGVTQRIRVGEVIGSSGWTLVSIANQKAVIRRNGEVRSIFVGQKL